MKSKITKSTKKMMIESGQKTEGFWKTLKEYLETATGIIGKWSKKIIVIGIAGYALLVISRIILLIVLYTQSMSYISSIMDVNIGRPIAIILTILGAYLIPNILKYIFFLGNKLQAGLYALAIASIVAVISLSNKIIPMLNIPSFNVDVKLLIFSGIIGLILVFSFIVLMKGEK